MRKEMTKKLYTLYKVEGTRRDILDRPDFVSYHDGYTTCVKYHDSIDSWVNEITSNDYKIPFGVESKSEDGKNIVIHAINYRCNFGMCESYNKDDLHTIMINALIYYLNTNKYYYEIEQDDAYIHTALTGHTHYELPYDPEPCNICDNCDKIKCDICKVEYTVADRDLSNLYFSGYDKKDAERVLAENQKDYSDIISDILSNYDINMEWLDDIIGEDTNRPALMKLLRTYKIPCVML